MSDEAHVEGWNPGSRREHRDQVIRAAIVTAAALAFLWWFEASALVQSMIAPLAFAAEAGVAYARRDRVALRALAWGGGVAVLGIAVAAFLLDNALFVAGAAVLVTGIRLKDVYSGGIGLAVAVSALRVTSGGSEGAGASFALGLMLAAVLWLIHVGIRRMDDDV